MSLPILKCGKKIFRVGDAVTNPKWTREHPSPLYVRGITDDGKLQLNITRTGAGYGYYDCDPGRYTILAPRTPRFMRYRAKQAQMETP